MGDAWLGNVGIRVTDLARSIAFYSALLDLEELDRTEDDYGASVLLRDRVSRQRLELNYYAPESPFYSPYEPGEGLDHLEVRVRSVAETLERLRELGVEPATRKVWTNPEGLARAREDARWASEVGTIDQDVWHTGKGNHIAYVQDPDGLFVCLYDHPNEPWDGSVPDHY